MKKIISLIIASLLVINLLGCATMMTSSFDYTPPSKAIYDNEIFVDRPFEVVWDELVKKISKSFYVINNIEKESRIINLSFSTDNPVEYVDCGESTREYGKEPNIRTYTYNVAESSSYTAGARAGGMGQFPVEYNMNREIALEGRVNIFVAPEGDGTNITVNCRYILGVSTSGEYETRNVFGQIFERGAIPLDTREVVFNTKQEKKSNWGTASEPLYSTCHSTGKLEQEILNFVK